MKRNVLQCINEKSTDAMVSRVRAIVVPFCSLPVG